MCQVLKISPSGYYSWCKRATSVRGRENHKLLVNIRVIHSQKKETYGSPRITAELNDIGFKCGENRVAKLMKANGIQAKMKRRFKPVTTDSKHNLPVAENLLNQNFAVGELNKIWVSDITYIPTEEGWLYLAATMDLYNRQIVGWSMSERITKGLVINALDQGIGRLRPTPGLIAHSDRGSQYASNEYQNLLKKSGMLCSMSRKGNCYDNACMESFFHSLKTELVYFTRYQTREEARREIFEYIEVFYNRVRRHSALGYKSPVEFQRLAKAA
jgi:putative transposase